MDYTITKIQKFSDKRGDLIVFLKEEELEEKHKQFGQIYFVTFKKKGIVRGNHYHKTFREWFGVVGGKVSVVLKDMKTGETTTLQLSGNDKEYLRLEIGPNIAHAFTSISASASLLNYTDKQWRADDVFPELLV